MNALILLLFFAASLLVNVQGYDTVSCTSDMVTYNLKSNSYTLFQTPNFPATMSINSNSSYFFCNAVFTSASSDDYIWMVSLNGVASQVTLYDTNNFGNRNLWNEYQSNFNSFNFSTTSNSLSLNSRAELGVSWAAFQAAIITYPKSSIPACPLSGQTFDFTADYQNLVIPVATTYGKDEIPFSTKNCQWSFKISPTQQLKVALNGANLQNGITLVLKNENSVIKTFTNSDEFQVFYYSGTNFYLSYEFNAVNTTYPPFFALVSAVQPSNTFTQNGCKTPAVNGSTTIFSNVDHVIGYPANQQCQNALYIPKNSEAMLVVSGYDYEAVSDKLFLTYGNNNENTYPLSFGRDPMQPTEYKISPPIQNDFNGQLMFKSDGNTQGAGYTAAVKKYECACAASFVIPCTDRMRFTPLKDSKYYCNEMKCTYTIMQNPSCPNSYFELQLYPQLRKTVDYLLVKSNGNLIQNITSDITWLDRFYAPSNKITIEFTSGSSSSSIETDPKSWTLDILPVTPPKFSKVTLNEKNSKNVLWLADMKEDDAYTICADGGKTLEMFLSYNGISADLFNYILYDGSNFDNYLGSLDRDALNTPAESWLPRNRKSSTGCFTIYLSRAYDFYNTGFSVLFRITDDTKKSCTGSNNVFQIPYSTSNVTSFDISSTSTPNGFCEMIIMSSLSYRTELPHVWISSFSTNSNEIHTFKSTINEQVLFRMNGDEASKWHSFGIYTPALSIDIPVGATITVHLSLDDQKSTQIQHTPSDSEQKGIMASPSLSGFMGSFDGYQLYSSNFGGNSFYISFTVQEMDGNSQPLLETGNRNLTLTHSIASVMTDSFNVFYAETNAGSNGFLIQYSIKQSNDPQASTTLASSLNSTILSSKDNSTISFSSSSLPSPTPTTSNNAHTKNWSIMSLLTAVIFLL